MRKSFLILIICLLINFFDPSLAGADDWVNINGKVAYNSEPVCAMVLANGQYMFTSAVDGNFNLDVPLDEYGQITVFAFCSGLAPFQQVIKPAEGQGMMIEMQDAGEGQGMDVACTVQAINATWVRLQGTMSYGSEAVCAMALANGQYMFTSQVDGHFSLDVPLEYIGDIGKVTLFGFCSGLPPYQDVSTTDQISFIDDADSDGYTINEGDPNDLDASIKPVSLYSGNYSGRFYGDDYGTFTFTVDSQGYISGTAYSKKYHDTYYGNGSVDASGAINVLMGNVSNGATFAGQIDSSGSVHGTWSNAYYGIDGTFSGGKSI